MKFRNVSEFKAYLENELLNEGVMRKHLNVFEDSREMIDIKKDKTNQTWDWMKNNTIYLVRSNSAGVLTYLYAPRRGSRYGKKFDGNDSDEKLRKIFYAQLNVRRIKNFFQGMDSLTAFSPYDVGDWDASNNDAKWVQAILEIDLGDRLLMNWNNVPWEDLK
jgi:hypothetical protein